MLSTLTPPGLPQQLLADFARRTYGLDGVWSRLEGERDQNFRVTSPNGASCA